MKQIFILGAYGQNNLGDEALLEVFIRQFQGAKIVVNSAQPAVTESRYGVQSVGTYLNWPPRFSRFRSMAASDVFVFGGGSLLKEIEGNWLARLVYFARILGILAFAKLSGKQTAMLGVGMGPLHYPFYKFLTRIAANMTGVICVRDTDSSELLKSVGVRRPVYVTADPVFTLTSPSGQAPLGLPVDPAKPFAVVVPRYSLTDSEQTALAAACDAIIENHCPQILFVPFQTAYLDHFDDTQTARQIQTKMRHHDATQVWVTDSPRDAFEAIGLAQFVVSARLHALIFGAMQGTPATALSYEVKVRSFMAEIGQDDYCLTLKDLEDGALPEAIDRLVMNRSQISAQMRSKAAGLRVASQRNFDILREAEAARDPYHLAGGSSTP
ncbi:MAG: polysaccharide pyruvyl transferase family protein [Anaerolineales bacterium]|nr:polysaccharide pyruvyl transferase family protein [Anaerolineales bacterium]